jgi:hypothetical protein
MWGKHISFRVRAGIGFVLFGVGERGFEVAGLFAAEHAGDYRGFEADAGQPTAGLCHFLDEKPAVRGGGREGGAIIGD